MGSAAAERHLDEAAVQLACVRCGQRVDGDNVDQALIDIFERHHDHRNDR